MQAPTHIVVLGAGFGGLEFCQRFRHASVRVTVVDRANHHLFQPLLYQVATAGLSAPDIAQPIRSILSRRPNITVLMETVLDFKLAERKVVLSSGELSYDYLVLALGGCTSYFGHPEWEEHAPGLKSLEDALRIRSQILLAFERAETETSAEEQGRLMTIVVVGGGPTGVELAGAFAELARHVLRADFRRIDSARARVLLIEGGPRILGHLPPDLSASAQRQLAALGVQVRLQAAVKHIGPGVVELASGEIIQAATILWAAGVAATPLAKKLGAELDRAGRVKVNPDLSVPSHAEVFAIGDMALVLGEDGKPVPGVSPAAMQMARHVARVIEEELTPSGAAARPPFRYRDKGTMATIGRSAAVAQVGSWHLSGVVAWLAWLVIHLIFLVGFRNKIIVLFQWFYSYITYKRGARLVVGGNPPRRAKTAAPR
ncbi:MAG: NAD(P)/FAD-dependent oxidoreductase [Limisphaerales bacterium]